MDILEMIDKHGLSIRKIPYEVVSKWFLNAGQTTALSGGDVQKIPIREAMPKLSEAGVKNQLKHFPDGYRYIETVVRTVEHGGWYMCQAVNDTSSTVHWDKKKDCLAPTLEESIQMFLDQNT